MLPTYPVFAQLHIDLKSSVDKITQKYPPYSDFNFVSLWSYDVSQTCQVSMLDNNFVVKMDDYITGEPSYTFLGNNEVSKTINALLARAKEEDLEQKLSLIPETNLIGKLDELRKTFDIKEDPDNYDYVISTKNLIELKGNKFRTKRKKVKQFISLYPQHRVEVLNLQNKNVQNHIKELFLYWEKSQNKSKDDTKTEYIATERVLKGSEKFDLVSIGIYIGNRLIAYTINEVVHDNFYIGEFGKADYSYQGSFQYAEHKTAEILQKDYGCLYMNFEQDLGLPELKKSKQSWRPIKFLKKYTIKKL